MNFPLIQKPENILLFTACQPPARLLKTDQETETFSFPTGLVWRIPAHCSVEKIQLVQLPGALLPELKERRLRPIRCGGATGGHKMQEASGAGMQKIRKCRNKF